MLNGLKRYYQENKEEIMKMLIAASYSISPWNTYRMYLED